MKHTPSLLAFFFLLPFLVKSQTSIQLNSGEIKQGLEALNVVGSVLYIAAHPDDENTRLLAYFSKGKKLRTGYLSLTRGDGGQNLIGNEQGDLLGLIRTQELLAARRTDGAEQFFTRAVDFGFSKNPEESIQTWNKQKILADVVWVIRKFRPDVIVTRFPEDSRAGHGQHSASAILAREAFSLAADPKQFPEQLAFVKPWQAKRILWNTFNFGGNNTTSDSQLKLDVGEYNFLLGQGYGELAADSRSNHKSQGFGSSKQRGSATEFFSAIGGSPAKEDLFEGINQTWDRINGGQLIGDMIQDLNAKYLVSDPAKSVPQLLKILTEVEKIKDEYWRNEKTEELKNLIVAASGLWFESYGKQPEYAIGDQIEVTSQVLIRPGNSVSLVKLGKETINTVNIMSNVNQMTDYTSTITAETLTQPYWLEERHSLGTFTVKNPLLIGYPVNPDVPHISYTFKINDKEVDFERPVVYKSTDPVRGEIYQSLVIAPPVTATILEKAYVFAGKTPKDIVVTLKSFKEDIKGSLKPKLPEGWIATPNQIDFSMLHKGEEKDIKFKVTPEGNNSGGQFELNIDVAGKSYHNGLREIKYDHIPTQTLFPLASARVEQLDLKLAGKKIGFIAGAGDLIPECLKQIGYEVTILTNNQILTSDLSKFDAIITGVRLYNINNQISSMQSKLLQYVEGGGTLLLQYNVNSPLKTEELGPFPFKLARDRVTEEDAKVSFLNPNDPALNFPNKITMKDFDGWIQERGIYFATDIDPRYTPVLSMHDKGEQPNNGSLIVANYGKGKFVYTSLVFFRELPAGVPGAYRLFVNLISNEKTSNGK
jgi:LmbE family N-acetylglucosaminyl deacetylase